MKRLFRIFKDPLPQFRDLTPLQLPQGLLRQYSNPVFWTPRYQKIPFTEDLLKYLRYLQRSNEVTYGKMRELVEHILTDYYTVMREDRPNYNIAMKKDLVIPSNNSCEFHGKADWAYTANGYNLTPIMFYEQKFNPCSGIAMALSNMHLRLRMKEAIEKEFKAEDQKYSHANTYGENNVCGYSIMTTGHEWQIIKIDRNFLLEKSVILEGRNKYRSMHFDQEMVSVVMGLLDYCLDLPHMNVKVLEKSYQYLDERRWMIEGADDDEIKKASWMSKWLTKYYKKKF